MARFRRITFDVEAERWWPGKAVPGVSPIRTSQESMQGVLADALARGMDQVNAFWDYGYIRTPMGPRVVMPGDWIVTMPDGTREVMPPDQFWATFEPAEEGPVSQVTHRLGEGMARLRERLHLAYQQLRSAITRHPAG